MGLLGGLISTLSLSAATLFSTDLETYRVGDDLLVGQDGWTATGTGTGISGVVADAVTGLGRSAFIGYGFPSSSPIRVFHGLGLPASGALPTRISVQGLTGVAASGAGDDDLFRIAIRLRDGSLVASEDPLTVSLRPRSAGGIDLSWDAPMAGTYQAQWSQDLSVWQSLGSPAKATTPGEALSVVDPASTGAARFYRITKQTP